MYRKDLFEKAGLTMPENPTWEQIRELACKLHDPANGVYGISMKGVSDYSQLAPFITLMHSFGAKWFDMNWHPQITSPEFKKAPHLLRQPAEGLRRARCQLGRLQRRA